MKRLNARERLNVLVTETIVGKVRVSTRFLNVTRRYGPVAHPVLRFETSVLGGKLDDTTEQCDTHHEALNEHQRMVDRVLKAENPAQASDDPENDDD